MTVDSQRPECTPITRSILRFLFCAWAKYKLTVRDWKIGNTKMKNYWKNIWTYCIDGYNSVKIFLEQIIIKPSTKNLIHGIKTGSWLTKTQNNTNSWQQFRSTEPNNKIYCSLTKQVHKSNAKCTVLVTSNSD